MIEALHSIKSSDQTAASIRSAIGNAASQAGLDFDFLLGVAQRESSLRADAKAPTSSASGLFQFIDQTWLGAVKEHGDAVGLSTYAHDIQRTDEGFTVADPKRRQEILNLRFHPVYAAKIAGQTLGAAKERLTASLGREASNSEVYMAHFLGQRGAVRMLSSSDSTSASAVDPRAAKANPSLFFQEGRALSIGEFKKKIALHIEAEEKPSKSAAETRETVAQREYAAVSQPAYAYSASRHSSYAQKPQRLLPQIQALVIELQSHLLMDLTDKT